MAERALMPDGRVLEPKTFTQAQYRNAKWGDEVEMATFLVLAILCFEEKPDVVIVYGIWVHDKDGDDSNFSLFYDANGLMRDPLTRQTIQGMGKDRLILDANWPDTIRMTDLDPSILVAPSGQGSMRDPDRKVVSAVARQITYGAKKTKSFLRVDASRHCRPTTPTPWTRSWTSSASRRGSCFPEAHWAVGHRASAASVRAGAAERVLLQSTVSLRWCQPWRPIARRDVARERPQPAALRRLRVWRRWREL